MTPKEYRKAGRHFALGIIQVIAICIFVMVVVLPFFSQKQDNMHHCARVFYDV